MTVNLLTFLCLTGQILGVFSQSNQPFLTNRASNTLTRPQTSSQSQSQRGATVVSEGPGSAEWVRSEALPGAKSSMLGFPSQLPKQTSLTNPASNPLTRPKTSSQSQTGDTVVSEGPGFAEWVRSEALPGAKSNMFGVPSQLQPQGSSGFGTGFNGMNQVPLTITPGNDINALYNSFKMPDVMHLSQFLGPQYAPPPPPQGQGAQGMPSIAQALQMPTGPDGRSMIEPTQPSDGGIQVNNMNCANLQSVIGLSNDRNQWLSTVECECRLTAHKPPRREMFCYSLCDPPKPEQRCMPKYNIQYSCPVYTSCEQWPKQNYTDGGAIACKVNEAVPESICWTLASSLLRPEDAPPLRPAFYANAAGGCFMSCICGNDGTVTGQLQCLAEPTSQWTFPVYPRKSKYDFSSGNYGN